MSHMGISHLDPTTWILILLTETANQVTCLSFNYTNFPQNFRDHFIFRGNSNIVSNIFQVTLGLPGNLSANLSGRILYNKQLKLWRKGLGLSSFRSKFTTVFSPLSNPPAEGLAFILTKDLDVPDNSFGPWLGITNASTDGSSRNNVVAVEFDTKKSFSEDVDDNHVGLDVNSVKSINQTSLTKFGVNLSSSSYITDLIDYNGTQKIMKVYVFEGNKTGSNSPVISMPIDLSFYLPEDVYVGFSASTGINTELNCVTEWYFVSSNIEADYAAQEWVVKIMIPVISMFSMMMALACYIYWRIIKGRRKDTHEVDDPTIDIEIQCSMLGPKKYQLKELKIATDNFSFRNEIGRGGFGIVYKGVLKGRETAIKRTTKTTKRGKQNLVAEVTTIGGIHHKNLVELMGWCYEGKELLLVYEYMPNKSLEKFIFYDNSTLSWNMRHNIICGVAQAIDYLHNECSKRVLHRDIKASNILLDSEFNARLGDFGLARSYKPDEKTHYSTKKRAGTLGYMAPETFLTGKATAQTDIYAFGVLVLEVACGRRVDIQTNDDDDFRIKIVDWVWEFHKRGEIINAIDNKLKGKFDKKEAKGMLVLGMACCHPNPYARPSIRTSLQVLKGEVAWPNVPLEKPAFVWPANCSSFGPENNHCLSGGKLSTSTDLSGR